MKLGVAIPQHDLGPNPDVAREFAQTAETIGFSHLAVYDHVLGANIANRPDWSGPFTSEHCFHDPFALFGYLAGQTTTIEFSPQVIILPQRQTALVAKQVASVDVLSGGRLRLGVGVGWNAVEFVGLNENFKDRGKRSEEQVEVMQQLWAAPHIDYRGKWHRIPDAGINPLPLQQPMPVWFGGKAEYVLDRIARLGAGWMTLYHQPDEQAKADLAELYAKVADAGRARDAVGVDVWVSMGGRGRKEWREEIVAWKALGASHITLNTAFNVAHHQRIDGTSLQDHLASIHEYHGAIADLL